MPPRLCRGRRAHGHLVCAILPLHRERLRGVMVCGCGRCDWLCFLCWVTVWAGICVSGFWGWALWLLPGKVLPVAECGLPGVVGL